MKNTLLGKVSRVLDIAVFVFTTMAIALVFWYFYLWFLYGSILIRRYISERE